MGQTADEVRREIERTRADMGYTLDAIGDRVSPRRAVERQTARVRSGFRGVKESVMGTAEDGKYRVEGAAGSIGSSVSGAASSAGDALASTPQMVQRQTRGNPIAAGLIAFGGGLLAASVLPKTDVEQQLAQPLTPLVDAAKDQARQAGQEVGRDVADSASQAAESVKSHAAQATETVKEAASSASSDVADQAATSADRVKGTAQGT